MITQTLVDDNQKDISNLLATRGAQMQLYQCLNTSTIKIVSSSMSPFLHL